MSKNKKHIMMLRFLLYDILTSFLVQIMNFDVKESIFGRISRHLKFVMQRGMIQWKSDNPEEPWESSEYAAWGNAETIAHEVA